MVHNLQQVKRHTQQRSYHAAVVDDYSTKTAAKQAQVTLAAGKLAIVTQQ